MPTALPTSANPILEWLSQQWFFLSALILGAGHAATAQAKIKENSEDIIELKGVPVAIALLEEKVNHLVTLATEQRNK